MERAGQGKISKVLKVGNINEWDSYINTAITENRAIVAHFGASWCIPSVAMQPVFEEMADAHLDVMFVFVDVDDVKELSSKMDVKAMPTFILIKGGKIVDKMVGANPEEIKSRISVFLKTTGLDMA